MRTVSVAGRLIGNGHPVFIIAEAGINHNGDIELAKELITSAKDCGADAIKFQSFQAEKICDSELTETKDVEAITGGSKSSFEMYRNLELTDEDHLVLFDFASKQGIVCFTSVFDEERVSFLDELGTPAFKIASSDITHLPLIEKAAATGKPVLISTGMSTLDEVAAAVKYCRDAGNDDILLFHCSCLYPPPDDEVNLNAIITMRERFGLSVGYSDHTRGTAVAIAAVALGAAIIEKHVTLDRNMPGPDHHLSLDMDGFAKMVEEIRTVEKAIGSFRKQPSRGEEQGLIDGRRSIMAAKDIPAGTTITRDMLKILKPARGLAPGYMPLIVGRTVTKDIKRQQPITIELLEGAEELCATATFAKH